MPAIIIYSDFGAPQNKVWHCFHCFPIYLPRSDGTGCHDLRCLNIELLFSVLFLCLFFYFTILYWFCPLTWIHHRCTCVPHPEPPSHLPPHPIPQGCPSALALSALFHASTLDWSSISHMVIYIFQCYSLQSSHPRLLPQSPKVCSLHLGLFCCLAYRVIITIFLNSIYMH